MTEINIFGDDFFIELSKRGKETLLREPLSDYGHYPPKDPKFLKFWADEDCKRCYGVGHLGITVADKPTVYVCECVQRNRSINIKDSKSKDLQESITQKQ